MRNICVICGSWMDHEDAEDPDFPVCPTCRTTTSINYRRNEGMSDNLTSSVGEINFMSVNRTVHNDYNGKDEYVVRLKFDGSTKDGKAFRETISAINSNLVVTKGCSGDDYLVKAASIYEPKVLNSKGEELDVIPHFTKGSTGKAFVSVKPFSTTKGGGIALTGVTLIELNLAEGDEAPKTPASTQAMLDKIAELKNIK